MCQICSMSRCSSGCPNAPEPQRVTTCHLCREPIVPGDEYARINGLDYCENCIDDMPYCELVQLFGGEWNTAREEDVPDEFDG